jgi:soluble P-type ATPase
VTVIVDVPAGPSLRLGHLILDVNGTLTVRGELVDGVADRIAGLREVLAVRLLSADTFGTVQEVAARLGVDAQRVGTGADKAAVAAELDAGACAAIGNGANDVPLLETVALGVAVIGPEGASPRALAVADVVSGSITDALDLLLDPRALVATLRR